MANSSVYTNDNLKELYVEYTINAQPLALNSFLATVLNRGGKPKKIGGKNTVYGLTLGNGSSAGHHNSFDVTHIGARSENYDQMKFTDSHLYARATIGSDKMELWNQSGMDGQFIDESLQKIDDINRALDHHINVLTCSAVANQFTTVTAAASAIAAAASGDIAVADAHLCRDQQVFQVIRSASALSGVLLAVDVRTNGVGAGTLTVTNTGTSSYTAAENDILAPAYYGSQNFLEPLTQHIGTAAYPTAGGNNDSIDHPYFRSYVVAASGSPKVTADQLALLKRYTAQQAPTDGFNAPVENGLISKQMVASTAFMGRNDLMQQILSAMDDKVRWREYHREKDPGWGDQLLIDQTPFLPSDVFPPGYVALVHFPGWAAGFSKRHFITSGAAGVWAQRSGRVDYEAIMQCMGSICVTMRAAQGLLTGVTGIGLSDVGLA